MRNLCYLVALSCLPVMAVSHWNGGRTVPVHRLTPRDHEGQKVSSTQALARPISTVQTCGQCHDVDAMKGANHFRTGLDATDAQSSVVVEPWFWTDDKTGTAIPLTLHGQQGAYTPAALGLSCWQWTKLFGRSFPGGGVGNDPRAMQSADGAKQRWFVTGGLEPNCLACHQQSGYDSSEWARQVLRENWRGAMTAASGLAIVDGMNERLNSTWDLAMGSDNPDDHLFRVPEKTIYDPSRFDTKDRCVFNVGKPKNENCLACHGVSEKGMPSHAIEGDVHLKHGLSCIDCHQNGMDHQVATTSCAGCHTAAKGAGPKPVHAGIPLVHFQKLACTVCHSGVTKDGELALVRTSRANRIGIYGRAQWATDCPYIVEPVFVKNAKGVVEPCRMMWPSGFYRAAEKGALKPIPPEEAQKLAGDAFDVVKRVETALAMLDDTSNLPGVPKLKEDLSLVYQAATNEIPFITATDRIKDEFLKLLITIYNAQIDRTETPADAKVRVAAVREGKVYTLVLKVLDDKGHLGEAVEECPGVAVPANEPFPVGTLSADGKSFIPFVDRWTIEQYFKVKGNEQPITKEMLARALKNAGKDVRYLSAGLVFSLDEKGALVETAGVAEAQPVSWPLAHDVRAARQARGAAPVKCADCHTGDSKFFLGEIKPTGPVQEVSGPVVKQADLLRVCSCYHTVLGSTFAMRPLLKVTLWTIFSLMCLFLAAAAGVALTRLGEWFTANTREFLGGLIKWVLDMGLIVCLGYLLLSGVIGWLCGGMSSWVLVGHMMAGGGFAGCAVLLMAIRAKERTTKLWSGVVWAFWVLFAAGTIFTAVMPMMTVFGSHGQEILLWSHRCVSLCFACASAVLCQLLRLRK